MAELEEAKKKLDETKQQLDNTNAQLSQKDTKIKQLEAESKQKGGELDTIKTQLSQKDAKIKELEEANKQKGTELDNIKAQLTQKDTKIKALEAESKQKESELDTIKTQLSQKDAKIKELEEANKQKGSELDTIKPQLTQKDTKIKELETESKQKGSELGTIKAQLSQKETKIKELEEVLKQKEALTTYIINNITKVDEITATPRDDIKKQINFEEYNQLFAQHANIIKGWNVNSNKLENKPFGKDKYYYYYPSMSSGIFGTWKFVGSQPAFYVQPKLISEMPRNSSNLTSLGITLNPSNDSNDDEKKKDNSNDVIGNELYKKYISTTKIMDEQTKRIWKIGTDDHIIQLINTQHEIFAQLQENKQRSEKNNKENEVLKNNHSETNQRRIKLIKTIEDTVNECNNTIDKENELLTNIKNKEHVLSLLSEQYGSLESSSKECLVTIELYNEFEEINGTHMTRIRNYFSKQWSEFEGKWWEWDSIDIISWFKYKTIGMDTNNVNWKLIKDEMSKRNINGKSLEHFNDSRLDMIGLHDFNIAVYVMKQIAKLRTKYKYISGGSIEDNDDDDTKNEVDKETKIPTKFICPLTKEMMNDPVTAFDKNVYEREAIEKYLKENGTSPVTGAKAFIKNVYSNQQLKKEIEAYRIVNNYCTEGDAEGVMNDDNATLWVD